MHPKIKDTFNQAAGSYDNHCHLQKKIGDQLLHFLKNKTYSFTSPNMIDLGCGTGIVTDELAKAFDFRSLHAIDIADRLLKKAADKLCTKNISVYQADFDYLSSYGEAFDIIFSNMALHWSTHLLETLKKITTLLSDSGLFAFSIPLEGTLNELQSHFSINQFVHSKDICEHFVQNGALVLVNTCEKIVLHFNDTLSALQSIRKVGANAVLKRRSPHLRGKSFLNNIDIKTLTYHIGYFIVRKSE